MIFALNVFDTMPPEIRKTSLFQISQLQGPEDRLLIRLDTNPFLSESLNQLQTLYPDHAMFPYFPLEDDFNKWSVVLAPVKSGEFKPTHHEFVELLRREAKLIDQGGITEFQAFLQQCQKERELKVIVLEDFFVEQVKKELEETGYQAKVYYHNSFTTGTLPENLRGIKEDRLYKAVKDRATIHQWSIKVKKFKDSLSQKDLHLPDHFDKAFLSDLRKKGKKFLALKS